MEIKTKITFEYETEKEAQIAFGSLKVDNMNFIDTFIQKNFVIFDLESRSLNTILATIDDLLFCEMISEKIIGFSKN